MPKSDLLPDTARTSGRGLLTAINRGAPPPPGYIVNLQLTVASLDWEPGKVVAGFVLGDAVCSSPGVVFGGHVAALHDQVAGLVMFSVIPDGVTFLTTRIDTRLLQATRPGPATIEAEVVQLTEDMAQVDVTLIQSGATTSRSAVTQSLRKVRTG
jgi:acyl-coenzyme A thioesterase PaaI-like protein